MSGIKTDSIIDVSTIKLNENSHYLVKNETLGHSDQGFRYQIGRHHIK